MKGKKAVKDAFTELAPRYEETVDDELRTFWGWSYEGFVDHLIAQTPINPGDRVLDIATGTAVIPRKFFINGAENNRFVGLDITENMLKEAQRKVSDINANHSINLTCGDAMALPFAKGSYDVVVSGLATHHMDIRKMLSESRRVLKKGGTFSIMDVGMSPFWQNPVMQIVSRFIAFFYFLYKENITRAWAEVDAVTNVWTADDWYHELSLAGFQKIAIEKIPSQRKWSPDPLSIRARN